MKHYVVTYRVCGIHHLFRCSAGSKRDAKRACCEVMNVKLSDITDVTEE